MGIIIKTSKKPGTAKPKAGDNLKTAILDLGADLGIVKSPRAKMRDEQQLISDIMGEAKKLRTRLQAIHFSTYRKKISEDILAEDQRKIAVLIVKLDDIMMAHMPDTRELDKVMFKLCDELEDAYKKGDTLTAHYIIETLTYGIANGHKTLLENEKDREEEVMAWREKKFNTYLKRTQAAQNIYQCGASVEANTEKLKEDGKLLKGQLKEIEDFQHDSSNPDNAKAMETIQKAGGRLNDLKGAAFQLAGMMKSAVRTYKECELLKKQISLAKVDMYNYNSMISMMEINLNEPNKQLTEELKQYIEELGNELMVRVNKQVNDIIDIDAKLNSYFNSMEAVFKQPAVENYIVGALEEFEQMQYTMEEDSAAYGRMMEREKYKQQDLEAEDSIFN